MADTDEGPGDGETEIITVRYWAAARAAAGVEADDVTVSGPLTVTAVRERAIARHPDTGLARVVAACSVIVGDQPLGGRDPDVVEVPPGTTVEFLPPFAGG